MDARPDDNPGGLVAAPAAASLPGVATVAGAGSSGRREGDRAGRAGPAAAYLVWISMHAAAGAMLGSLIIRTYPLFLMMASIPVMIVQDMLNRLGVPYIPKVSGGDLASPVMLYLGPPLFGALLGAMAGPLTWPLAFWRGLGFRPWARRSVVAWAAASLSTFGLFVAFRRLLAPMPERVAGALASGLVLSGLAVLLIWPLAWWKGRTAPGRVFGVVVILAAGLGLGFGMLALPKDLGEAIDARASTAFIFACAGFLSGRPLFKGGKMS